MLNKHWSFYTDLRCDSWNGSINWLLLRRYRWM